MKKLGLGIQALSEFKDNNFIYVDKTEQIHRLIDDGKYYFLPTGVSKFSRVSIFSDLNRLRDLSISESGAGLLGYTDRANA